jgi:vancomycin resistance protein YoaR
VLALLYVGDLLFGSGSVPRGVTVAGVAIGGLGRAAAEQQLRGEVEPRTGRPVPVTVGQASSEIDPAAAGLSVDWPTTLDAATAQPLNPITRLRSFFTAREVPVTTRVDQDALTGALGELSPIVDRDPVEGGVTFTGTTPVPVPPVPGQRLDVPAAADVLRTRWVFPGPVALPLVEQPPVTTAADVDRAIAEVARPAVSGPVTVAGENGAQGVLTPEVIASALKFRGQPGGLVPELDQDAVAAALGPQLGPSETPGRDAAIDFSSGKPVVTPSQDGRGVDYQATIAAVLPALSGQGERRVDAVYADKPAALTTEELSGLGITGVIGEFQTGGFAVDSGRNIKRAAELINGTVVAPGETFSLNRATEPRDEAHGFVEAGVIDNGRAGRGVAGGTSQVATTLYNAAYFAGMTDVTHKEHSFYISRYPPGREATVVSGAIDMQFRNDNPTGVLIRTEWTPTTLTIRLYGTKRYEVTSTPGPRTNPTQPNTVNVPAGQPCVASNGAPGFTITDTRTLKDVATGQVRTETRTVRYNPVPIVVCG